MRLARAVWLIVAVLALVGLVIATRVHGGPQAIISALQTAVVVRQTQSATEATAQTLVMVRQTERAAEATAYPAQAPLAATVRALETQVARLQQPSTPTGPSPVLSTPAPGLPNSQDQPHPTQMNQ
jgi:hypothetical protein